ncbi:hypothetical protein [Microlunatus sp. Gsoil 973]|uniref:hypothetical protein n=1 Tax=Microlunatus sp. Gsoil 973 TaxID=2672569 RepID=UPI001E2833AF|nr:hypothetical protein [Microlunatus sp. Gsoil 973]
MSTHRTRSVTAQIEKPSANINCTGRSARSPRISSRPATVATITSMIIRAIVSARKTGFCPSLNTGARAKTVVVSSTDPPTTTPSSTIRSSSRPRRGVVGKDAIPQIANRLEARNPTSPTMAIRVHRIAPHSTYHSIPRTTKIAEIDSSCHARR